MNGNFDLEKRMYDSSSIADFMGCPQLFEWGWVRRLEPKEAKAPLLFGKAFHEVLLEWYRSGKMEEAIKKFDSLPKIMSDDYRTKEWGEAIFKEYVERYAKESGKTLHLEVKFKIEIGERIYAGTIDRVEDWNGKIYVDDHKTTKMLGLSFFESYRPNPQMDGYCYACRELCGGCVGAIINGISVAKAPKERFQRFISSRSPEEIDRWREDFTNVTDEIERSFERKKFRMNTTWCHRWGRCKFWDLCVYYRRESEMREKFIEQNFKRREEESVSNSNEIS